MTGFLCNRFPKNLFLIHLTLQNVRELIKFSLTLLKAGHAAPSSGEGLGLFERTHGRPETACFWTAPSAVSGQLSANPLFRFLLLSADCR